MATQRIEHNTTHAICAEVTCTICRSLGLKRLRGLTHRVTFQKIDPFVSDLSGGSPFGLFPAYPLRKKIQVHTIDTRVRGMCSPQERISSNSDGEISRSQAVEDSLLDKISTPKAPYAGTRPLLSLQICAIFYLPRSITGVLGEIV
jgi:hypothetical protein